MEKKTIYLTLFAIAVLAVAVLAYTEFSAQHGATSFNAQIGQKVPQSVVAEMNVPSSVSNKIGAGSVSNPPYNINASPLLNGTKPLLLYIGADYCPYCAISRWGLIVALLRFGNFSNLHYMASNSSDVYPNTPTFSFHNSTYQSDYISFAAVETTGRSRYQPLQNPTNFENTLISTYDTGEGIPFIDFANISIQTGAPATPEVLQGYTWNETISNLTAVNSSTAQVIVGTADVYTAEICRATNMTPASVCVQPYVTRLLKALAPRIS